MLERIKSLLHLGGDRTFTPPPPEPVVDARADVQLDGIEPSQRLAYRRNLRTLEALFRRLHDPHTLPAAKPALIEEIGRRQRVLEASGLPVPVRLSECHDALTRCGTVAAMQR